MSDDLVKRYDVFAVDDFYGPATCSEEDDLGPWVRYEDHEKRIKTLEAKLSESEALLENAVEALDDLLEATTAEDRFGDRSLTITGPLVNLKELIHAEDTARTTLAEIKGQTNE